MVADNPRGHGQQANDKLFNCPSCRGGNCHGCPDKIFLILGKNPTCTCKKSGHADAITGEPRAVQVADPFTGDIHGPGGTIVRAETGEVERPSS